MEKLKQWLRDWLGVTNKEYVLGVFAEAHFQGQLDELKERIQDLENQIQKFIEELRLHEDNIARHIHLATDWWQRIEDLEDAYPGYKQAKEEADAKPEPLVPGFMPFSKRKRAFELSHRKPETK